jgi:biotin operon repressor
MSVHTTPHAGAASKISFACAFALLSASVVMNGTYGWQRGGDVLALRLVWASLAAASAISATLAWPAFSKAVEQRKWSAAAVAFVGLLLFTSYNCAAAIGSAAGGRTNAAAAEYGTDDKRAKAQAAYNAAKSELDALKASRPVAELEPLVEAARPVCRIVVTNRKRETVCAKPAALTAELGRAKRREALEVKMAKAAEDLTSTGPARVANSDAKAISTYLTGLGWEVTEDRVNKWLVLLAVLLVECGGGIALTIGQALSAATLAGQTGQRESAPQTATAAPASQNGAAPAKVADHLGSPQTKVAAQNGSLAGHAPTPSQSGSPILAALSHAGGRVESLRKLADQIGRSRAAVSAEVKAMAAAGLVTTARGRHGTVVALARLN